MSGFPSPFGSKSDSDLFDEYSEFVPGHVPDPGEFLGEQDILTDDDHVAFHEITREIFEERKVYDMTFDYNLARLNLDTRHPGAGYRYARETEDSATLRAEFTPTTPFCPQTHTLTKASFRAWNGLSERHEYEVVRVRVDDMHHQSETVNEQLEDLEETYIKSGRTAVVPDGNDDMQPTQTERRLGETQTQRDQDAPF